MASGWSRSTGPSGPVAATGPRATPWTPSGPAAKPWPRDHLTTPRQRGHREALRVLPWREQLRACAALVAAPGDPVERRATVQALRLTAERVLAARQDAHQLEAEL